ncbi:Type II secretion system protein G [Candidatus Magnetaquicoccaceae bacterium FCR-1]|uniref:Type II secretion system core protein G n=1 Tax=Candidatus Magnetaquiglobus chichijimensis TaxID=3141448 RepID=A0ABQ0C9C2_9PROT
MKSTVYTPPPRLSQAGFTLIEIMVVVVILGILATLIIPKVMSRPDEARQTKAVLDIQSIGQALDLYRLDNNNYPTTEQGLQALVTKPESEPIPRRWRSEGYLPKPPVDPWSNPYVYLSPGLHGAYDLMSLGADGMPGGENKNGDITSWNLEIKP